MKISSESIDDGLAVASHRYNLLLFAVAKEVAGTDRLTLEMSRPATARELLSAAAVQVPALANWVPVCRLAVDHMFVSDDHVVEPSSELALIPPVSGG